MQQPISRTSFLSATAATAFASVAILRSPAFAADVTVKIGTDLEPTHPTVAHLQSAAEAIGKDSNGAIDVKIFPSNQLGNDDKMLSQVRSGALEIMAIGDNILAQLVPATGLNNIGFAWKDPAAAFAACDGGLGSYERDEISKRGLFAFEKIWDEGFRQMTSSTRPIHTPADLAGFKMRVPPSPISTSLIRDLGASPTTINYSDLYSALQTHVVDGQENPLSNIETQRFYEVQKYCSLTNHMWVGYWLIANAGFWSRLDPKVQQILDKRLNEAAVAQRVDSVKLNDSLRAKLTSQGLAFNTTDPKPFRDKLIASGFYKDWQGTFGDVAWKLLGKYAGNLA
jgi:tripartite ATP-independent transporter DctP family solute receptor